MYLPLLCLPWVCFSSDVNKSAHLSQQETNLDMYAVNILKASNRMKMTTADHPPKVWEQHVDDVFSIVHKMYLQELLEHINNLHPQTQFTKEEENNSILPFLDTLVQRNHDKTMLVKIYRKPMHASQYLKYTSHNPISATQSVITVLFDQADNVVSNKRNKIEEKYHILAALQQNSYPKEFIQRTIKKHNRRKEHP